MANLTITVEDEALKKARMRALEQGISVNALLREYLESYAGVRSEQLKAVREIIALSRASESRRGQRKWKREELYERQ